MATLREQIATNMLTVTKFRELLRRMRDNRPNDDLELVRKAYEQGRVLDPEELTDEALFRLITRDQNIRVLITREIEDRDYIHANA